MFSFLCDALKLYISKSVSGDQIEKRVALLTISSEDYNKISIKCFVSAFSLSLKFFMCWALASPLTDSLLSPGAPWYYGMIEGRQAWLC